MTNQELKISATYLKKLASFPDAEDRISLYLDSLFATQPQKGSFDIQENKTTATSSVIHFTQKEINQMPKHSKKNSAQTVVLRMYVNVNAVKTAILTIFVTNETVMLFV